MKRIKYRREELEEALSAIDSTVSKVEKVQAKDTLGASQRTLIERRLKAFRVASELIEARLAEMGS